MAAKHWQLEDIPWERFDRAKVDADLLKVIKAASLVEYNGADYATYLCNVFSDDEAFHRQAQHPGTSRPSPGGGHRGCNNAGVDERLDY